MAPAAEAAMRAPCPPKLVESLSGMGPDEARSFVFHGYTNRSVVHHVDLHPPWFDLLTQLNTSRPDFRLMDIGAGSGRTLLELQAMYPHARLVGTNYAGWGRVASPGNSKKTVFVQAESSTDLYRVAIAAGIPLMCAAAATALVPVIPEIILLPSFDSQNFSLTNYVSPETFDWILSVHALNNKLEPDLCHVYMASVVHALAPGGTALVHTGSLATPFGRQLLSSNIHRTVTHYARVHGVSLFLVLHGFEVMMIAHRYTNEQDREVFERPFLRSMEPIWIVRDLVKQVQIDIEMNLKADQAARKRDLMTVRCLLERFGQDATWALLDGRIHAEGP